MLDDKEIKARLKKLQDQLQNKSDKTQQNFGWAMKAKNRFITALIEFIGPILLGLFIGRFLDDYFEQKFLVTLILLILGFITGIYNLVKLGKK